MGKRLGVFKSGKEVEGFSFYISYSYSLSKISRFSPYNIVIYLHVQSLFTPEYQKIIGTSVLIFYYSCCL